jgi:hypothetical protein
VLKLVKPKRPTIYDYRRSGLLPVKIRERDRTIHRSQVLTIRDVCIVGGQESVGFGVALREAYLKKHGVRF